MGIKPIRIYDVSGKDWNEIQENARAIANIPEGSVNPSYGNSITLVMRHGTYHADVTVTPASEDNSAKYSIAEMKRAADEVFKGGGSFVLGRVTAKLPRSSESYTLGELQKAARGCGSSGDWYAELMAEWALQVRKNRVFDSMGGK